MARTRNELSGSELVTIGELGIITGPKVIYTNDSGVYEGLTLGAGEGIRRNAGDTAFEAFTPGSGSGDVVGPAGATDENIAVYDTNTGKLIKDGGAKVSDLATIDYVDEGSYLYPPIEDFYDPTGGLPVGPSVGDRYISEATANGWTEDYIYEWDGVSWVETTPEEGWMVWDLLGLMLWVFFSGGWMEIGDGVYLPLVGGTMSGDITTSEAIGRDTDNEIAWTTDDQLDITIGGVTTQIASISTGTGDNDKLVTQGYVDDAAGGGGDVTAAANMTDNTLIKGDGGAKGIQDSGITIDDSDNVSGVGTLGVTSTAPEVTIWNTTETDIAGSRLGKLTFKGEQSGGEISTLGTISASHNGSSDDERGSIVIAVNDGNDGTSPTSVCAFSAGVVRAIGNLYTTDMYINNAGACNLNFTDENTDDFDVSAKISAVATDTGSGTEDVDVTMTQQVAGADHNFLVSDADGDIDITSAAGNINLNNDVITTDNIGRDTDNYIGWGTDDNLDIKIGGTTTQIASISTGTGDNDKLVTQGYVDDNAGGFTDPMTTRGDIIYKNSAGTTTRLGAGTVGQVLTSDGTDIAWDDASGGGGTAPQVQFIQTNFGVVTLFAIPIHTTFTASGVRISTETLPVGANVQIDICKNGIATTNSIFTSDTPLSITTAQAASNGIYQTVGTAIDNGSFSAGDVIYGICRQQGSTIEAYNLSITVY